MRARSIPAGNDDIRMTRRVATPGCESAVTAHQYSGPAEGSGGRFTVEGVRGVGGLGCPPAIQLANGCQVPCQVVNAIAPLAISPRKFVTQVGRSKNLADEIIPHFYNDPGVQIIEIGDKKFM